MLGSDLPPEPVPSATCFSFPPLPMLPAPPGSQSCHLPSTCLQRMPDTACLLLSPKHAAAQASSTWETWIEFLGTWWQKEAQKTNSLKLNNIYLYFQVFFTTLTPWGISPVFCRFSLAPSMELRSPLPLPPFKYPSKPLSQPPKVPTSLFKLLKVFYFFRKVS